MYSFRGWRKKYGRITIHALWDLFMVWMVIINLTVIIFDFTYLWLRPTYFRYVPVVTRVWDPVLGIRPHPLTDELIAEANTTQQLFELDPTSPALIERLENLRQPAGYQMLRARSCVPVDY